MGAEGEGPPRARTFPGNSSRPENTRAFIDLHSRKPLNVSAAVNGVESGHMKSRHTNHSVYLFSSSIGPWRPGLPWYENMTRSLKFDLAVHVPQRNMSDQHCGRASRVTYITEDSPLRQTCSFRSTFTRGPSDFMQPSSDYTSRTEIGPRTAHRDKKLNLHEPIRKESQTFRWWTASATTKCQRAGPLVSTSTKPDKRQGAKDVEKLRFNFRIEHELNLTPSKH